LLQIGTQHQKIQDLEAHLSEIVVACDALSLELSSTQKRFETLQREQESLKSAHLNEVNKHTQQIGDLNQQAEQLQLELHIVLRDLIAARLALEESRVASDAQEKENHHAIALSSLLGTMSNWSDQNRKKRVFDRWRFETREEKVHESLCQFFFFFLN
jgi:DNA repair exonuclease SbcCD ATPase subunit